MRQLAWKHDWHIRDDTHMVALARIIDTHRALPLAAVWSDGRTSSSGGLILLRQRAWRRRR